MIQKQKKKLVSGKLYSFVCFLSGHTHPSFSSCIYYGRHSSWVLFLFLYLVVLNLISLSYHNDFFLLPIALYFYSLVPLVITIRHPNLVLLYAYEETDSDAKIIHHFLPLLLTHPSLSNYSLPCHNLKLFLIIPLQTWLGKYYYTTFWFWVWVFAQHRWLVIVKLVAMISGKPITLDCCRVSVSHFYCHRLESVIRLYIEI